MLKNIKLRIEVLFVIIGLFWGTILLLINPPFQAADEDDHLFKMWGFINGNLTFKVKDGFKGQVLPSNLVMFSSKYQDMKHNLNVKTTKDDILNLANIPLDKNNQVFYAQSPAGYTVLSYIPAIFVLFILKIFDTPPLFMLYILRFCCLLTYLAIMYQAIKITPYKKWLFFILGLVPTCLYISSAINTDCLVISSSFFLIAYTLYLKFDENIKKISNKQILQWCALFTFICMLKYLYFSFILLYFFIPKKKLAKSDKYIIFLIVTAIINIVFVGIFLLSQIYFSTLGRDYYNEDSQSVINMLKFLIANPIPYIIGLVATPILSCFSYFKSFIAQFGWKTVNISIPAVYLYYFLIFLFLYREKKDYTFTLKNKLIMLLTIIIIFIIALSSEALLYGAFPIMFGFQGRYASPFLPLLFLLFDSNKLKINNNFVLFISILLLQVIYLHVVFVLINRFYY